MRVNSTDFQNSFGKYLALVDREDIIIVKNGKTVAKLIPFNVPEHYYIHENTGKYEMPRRISYEEYMAIVENSDQRYELIDGEIYLLAAPSYKHQVAVSEIAWYFSNYFRGKPCRALTAPLDVRLFGMATKFEEDPNVVQPDVLVVCDQDNVNEKDRYTGVPALVVEVLSPSTRGKDMAAKLNLYMKSGVTEYWLVDLEGRSITQYCCSDRDIDRMESFKEGDTVESALFKGLEIPVNEIAA